MWLFTLFLPCVDFPLYVLPIRIRVSVAILFAIPGLILIYCTRLTSYSIAYILVHFQTLRLLGCFFLLCIFSPCGSLFLLGLLYMRTFWLLIVSPAACMGFGFRSPGIRRLVFSLRRTPRVLLLPGARLELKRSILRAVAFLGLLPTGLLLWLFWLLLGAPASH